MTAQSWNIRFSFVNCLDTSRTIRYNKYQQKNGTLSAPKIPFVTRGYCRDILYFYLAPNKTKSVCQRKNSWIPLMLERRTNYYIRVIRSLRAKKIYSPKNRNLVKIP